MFERILFLLLIKAGCVILLSFATERTVSSLKYKRSIISLSSALSLVIALLTASIIICVSTIVSAKYCYVTHELRLHQNDRCKRFTLF